MVIAFLLAAALFVNVWRRRQYWPLAHRRLGRRPDRPERHLAGAHAVARRQPQPARQGARLHRQQHRGHAHRLRPRRASSPSSCPRGPTHARRSSRPTRARSATSVFGTPTRWSRATASCRSCAPTTRSSTPTSTATSSTAYTERRCSRRASSTSTACRRNAQTWVNQHITYTHGFGVALSAVNQVTADGSPDFLVQDVPPQLGARAEDHPAAHLLRREGHRLHARQDERPGVRLPGRQRRRLQVLHGQRRHQDRLGPQPARLLPALQHHQVLHRLGDHRREPHHHPQQHPATALTAAAPFLSFDDDPYMVIAGGRLFWIVDGYTTTTLLPVLHAAGRPQLHPQLGEGGDRRLQRHHDVLRLRPDATRSCAPTRRSSPACSRRSSKMPASLRAHMRYPEGYFNTQAQRVRDLSRAGSRRALQQGRPVGRSPTTSPSAARARPWPPTT